MTKKEHPMHAEAYSTGVLRPLIHDRIVADLDGYARDAAIHRSHIYTSLKNVVGEEAIAYAKTVRQQRAQGVSGVVFEGQCDTVEVQFAALAGFFTRNFLRARVLTLGQFIDRDGAPDYSIVLVPNFFVGKALTGELPSWRAQLLMDAMVARHIAGQQTFVYVSDRKQLTADLGSSFKQLFEAHYHTISA